MSLPIRVHWLAAILLATAFTGCAQMTSKLPTVSLKPSQDKTTRFSVARLYEKQNRLGAARKLYGELHDESPRNLEVLHRLAAISTRLGDFEQANKYFEESLAIDSNNSDVMADYGYSLYLQNNVEAAESMLNRSLDLNPDNHRAVGNLALLAGMNGRIDESLTLYRSIVGEAEAQANVAYIHVQRGEGEQAMEKYSRALTLDEKMESAANALIKLSELKNTNKESHDSNDTSDIVQIADKPLDNQPPTTAATRELVRGQSDLPKSAARRKMASGPSNISSPRLIKAPDNDKESEPAPPLKAATANFSF